jgi:hypothetical protein
MQLLMIIIFATATYFRDDIKVLDSYSLYSELPSISYDLKTKDDNNNDLALLSYKPHVSSFLGFSATIENIGLSFVYQNEDEDKLDVQESDLFDLQFQGAYNKVLWNLYYQNYHGLYITDSDIDSSNLPTAHSYTYGLGIKYFTKDSYSLKKSLSNFSNTKVTDWSWFHGVFASKFKLYSEDTLIPTQYLANFAQLKGLTSFEAQNIGYEFGFTGLYTFGKMFADILIGPGIQFQRQQFSGIEQEPRVLTSSSISLMLDLGYDAKVGSFGVKLNQQSMNVPVKNAEFTNQRSVFQFYYKYFF